MDCRFVYVWFINCVCVCVLGSMGVCVCVFLVIVFICFLGNKKMKRKINKKWEKGRIRLVGDLFFFLREKNFTGRGKIGF